MRKSNPYIARGIFIISLDSRYDTLSGFGTDYSFGTLIGIDDILLKQ